MRNALTGATSGALGADDGERGVAALKGDTLGAGVPLVFEGSGKIVRAAEPGERFGAVRDKILNYLDPVGTKKQAADIFHANALTKSMVDEGPYQAIIDRLGAQDAKVDRAYRDSDWNMSEGGHDFRKNAPLARPLYLGDMDHPAQAGKRMPIVLKQGWQDITDPTGSGEGIDHIEFRHGALLRKLGFKDAPDYLRHIVENGNVPAPQANGKYALIFKNDGASSNSLHDQAIFEFSDEGDHFSVHTAFPRKYRRLKNLVWHWRSIIMRNGRNFYAESREQMRILRTQKLRSIVLRNAHTKPLSMMIRLFWRSPCSMNWLEHIGRISEIALSKLHFSAR